MPERVPFRLGRRRNHPFLHEKRHSMLEAHLLKLGLGHVSLLALVANGRLSDADYLLEPQRVERGEDVAVHEGATRYGKESLHFEWCLLAEFDSQDATRPLSATDDPR
jgi:hypothetical protein